MIAVRKPSESLRAVLKAFSLLCKVMGVDAIDPKYHFNFFTALSILYLTAYHVCTLYTAFQHRDDFGFMLQVLCTIGAGMLGVVKLGTVLKYSKILGAMRTLIEHLYTEYEMQGTDFRRALYNSCNSSKKIIKAVSFSYVFLIFTILVPPFSIMAINGQRQVILLYDVPGLNITTNFGYITITTIHTINVITCAIGFLTTDIFVLLFLSQSYLFVNVFKVKVKEFNESVTFAKNRFIPATEKALEDLLKWHTLYLSYTRTCNNIFFIPVTVQVVLTTFSITLTLYVILTSYWLGAYSFLGLMAVNLYILCIMGTKVENCNDEFCFEIYNISWYNLTVAQQKTVKLMLLQSQSPNVITIASVMPLSVSSAMKITKGIYSIFMMMVQLLVE
ncbi:putative odorant receptor 83c [Teleopsis dalmanni]|uniref:putative odorant receptor 83c n=1 Tax=Teleopsis dalmanni TaxID=139649 RepID=UPI0018CD2C07|nr:putative odorant receptor 83c [Teleopsis dalmanni]